MDTHQVNPSVLLSKVNSLINLELKKTDIDQFAKSIPSGNIKLKNGIHFILLQRAFGELDWVLQECSSEDETQRQMALCCIAELSSLDAFVYKLGKRSILKKLVASLSLPNSSPMTQSYALLALLRITQDSDKRKQKLVKYHILKHLERILMSNDSRHYWLYNWALSLAHSLSLSDSIQTSLLDNGYFFNFAILTKKFYGISSFQKMTLHSMVRLLSYIDSNEVGNHLMELENINFSLVIATALKNDDMELVCWAAFILHEYASKDVCKSVFVSTRGLIKPLLRLLSHEDTCIPRIVIRSLKNLATDNFLFQDSLVKQGAIPKIAHFLRPNTVLETQYWAVCFFHTLLKNDEMHSEFLNVNGLVLILDLAPDASPHVQLYLSDIIISLLANVETKVWFENSEILDYIFQTSQVDAPELGCSGITIALSMITLSEKLCRKFVENGGIQMLTHVLFQDVEMNLKTIASKALVTLAKRDSEYRNTVLTTCFIPLLQVVLQSVVLCIQSVFSTGSTDSVLASPLSDDFDPSFVQVENKFFITMKRHKSLSLESNSIEGGDFSPLLNSPNEQSCEHSQEQSYEHSYEQSDHSPNKESFHIRKEEAVIGSPTTSNDFDKSLKNCRDLSLYLNCLHVFLYRPIFDLDIQSDTVAFNLLHEFATSILDIFMLPLIKESIELMQINTQGNMEELEQAKDTLSIHSLRLISSLVRFDALLYIFLEEHVFSLLFDMAKDCNDAISSEIIVTLANSLCNGLDKSFILDKPELDWTGILETIQKSPRLRFYGSDVFKRLIDYTLEQDKGMKWSPSLHSLGLYIHADGVSIRNDSWTFESCVCTKSVSRKGKYAYDVLIETNGIIQVGWTCHASLFDPEGGQGVGDDEFSYSIDGQRAKKWHGKRSFNNHYGKEWRIGDVISVMIDLDLSEMRFARNGVDMGAAFVDFDVNLEWFPALSMAGEQQVQVIHGNSPLLPLSTRDLGYIPLIEVVPELANDQQPNIPPTPLELSSNVSMEFQIVTWNIPFKLFPHVGVMDKSLEKMIQMVFFQYPNQLEFYSCAFFQSTNVDLNEFASVVRNELDLLILTSKQGSDYAIENASNSSHTLIKTLYNIPVSKTSVIQIQIPLKENHVIFRIQNQTISIPWKGLITDSIMPCIKDVKEYELTFKHPCMISEVEFIKFI